MVEYLRYTVWARDFESLLAEINNEHDDDRLVQAFSDEEHGGWTAIMESKTLILR